MNVFPSGASVNTHYMGGNLTKYSPSMYGVTAGSVILLRGCNYDGVTSRSYGGIGDRASRLSGGAIQVPVGLTLRIVKFKLVAISSNPRFQLGYSDSNTTIYGTNTVPTTPVYETGAAGVPTYMGSAAIGDQREFLCDFAIPATKYPMISDCSGGVYFEGIGVLE